ncbi:bifunctional 2-keto-4-hydroxyglutarate aldolase/2-keto-3-deoxy-6-phosphogluconate aldolase [Paraburkholderia sp. IMGN_8]|uniref:bifunctional 4-hydroxy-2-oxoglutarate aldolase/2-dehydro-3-deoxy-phosphogluconate aldolase n=1 Tax=Paraburkholderia sp. IMGN_8 TaxID=3136564 RepID=UPI003100EA5E
MNKLNTLDRIRASKIVAIVREKDPDVALNAAIACCEGGITCIEIALTTVNGLGVLSELAKISDITVGAGTVLDADTASTAIRMGASFLLSPSVIPEMIRVCSRYGAVSIPSAFTPTEVLSALEAGADIVKIFPASTGGLTHIESIGAQLPQASLMPSGRVSVDDVGRWFVKGVVAVGVGGALTSCAKTGDFSSIRQRARQLVAMVQRMGTEPTH